MITKEELIKENTVLKSKLVLAEAWMRREVAGQRRILEEESEKKWWRKKLDNMLERESIDIMTRRIETYFWENLKKAPKFTLEHLIDAEIYWQTLQKFPTLDALPVVSSYQKILDSFFEKVLEGFRNYKPSSRMHHESSQTTSNPYDTKAFLMVEGSMLDRDIENIILRKYSLSLGRWFQFFQMIREGKTFGWNYEDLLLQYMTEKYKNLLDTCIMDPFFSGFSELISLEVFGRKRHDTKISYADAKRVRELCMQEDSSKSIIHALFCVE